MRGNAALSSALFQEPQGLSPMPAGRGCVDGAFVRPDVGRQLSLTHILKEGFDLLPLLLPSTHEDRCIESVQVWCKAALLHLLQKPHCRPPRLASLARSDNAVVGGSRGLHAHRFHLPQQGQGWLHPPRRRTGSDARVININVTLHASLLRLLEQAHCRLVLISLRASRNCRGVGGSRGQNALLPHLRSQPHCVLPQPGCQWPVQTCVITLRYHNVGRHCLLAHVCAPNMELAIGVQARGARSAIDLHSSLAAPPLLGQGHASAPRRRRPQRVPGSPPLGKGARQRRATSPGVGPGAFCG
mmetsp:Transcript_33109/g.87558  ORF Transcript_33109/g.87558 Transcript_33109/m.87558 type:complete len:300 (+) Transcript_33109:721-1620(+)